MSDRTRASGTDWALGIEARSRALLSDRRSAEPLKLGIRSPRELHDALPAAAPPRVSA